MKSFRYSIVLLSSLLGGSLLAQETQTLSPGGQASIPAVAEALALQVASNAVQAAKTVWLTNQAPQAARTDEGAAQAITSASNSMSVAGSAVLTASTNAMQAVKTVRLTGQRLLAAPAPASAKEAPGSPLAMDSTATCVRAGSGLVGWWQAEGDANDSAGSHHGQWVNGTSYDSGMVGQAFSFNGSSQAVEIPYSSSLATPSFTIETWIYPTAQIDGQAFLFGQSYGRQLVVQGGENGLWVAIYITDPDGNFIGLGSSQEIPIGDWTYLAATWDGTYLKLYINGALDAQGMPEVSDIGDSACSFSIGAAGFCAPSQYFPGLIDEVSLYDRALFPGEINSIMVAGAAGKCKSPPACFNCPDTAVSWWDGEGDASDAFRANAATLQNGAGFAAGITGQGFSFDGISQSAQIPYSSASAAPNFSFEAWVKPSAQLGGQGWILGQGYGRQLVVHPGNRGLNVAFYINTDPYSWYEVDSSAEIPLGQWTHLAATFDGTVLSLYVNGALDQQAVPGVAAWDSGCPFSLGGANDLCGAYGQYFPGLIDEPTLYNTALPPDQVQAIYNAGSAGKCNIPGSWLEQYFGPNYRTDPNAAINADPDHDGLTNIEEYQNGVDPTKSDTDGDGLGDGAEIHSYGSNPAAFKTFNAFKCDSEYFHTAKAGEDGLTEASFDMDDLGGGVLVGWIWGSLPGGTWDLYYVNSIMAQRWQWRRVLAGIECDDAGEATFQLEPPESPSFFVILSAEDTDGDGLTDGYEAWFHRDGRRTDPQDEYSDLDHMKDGWEVEYGLDPMDNDGDNGDAGNPDQDSYNNLPEHTAYYAAPPGHDATFDPIKPGPTQRPVVTIAPAEAPAFGFIISRDVGLNGSKANPLTVYYALGGSARYGAAHDYLLDPLPVGWPRICAVDIPAGEDFVTVTLAPTDAGLARGPLCVVLALTPYSVALQNPEPPEWQYAVDWNHNRATNCFAGRADGFTINLNKDPVTGYLTIKPTANTTPLPYVNLASSGRGTVARIEVPSQWNPSLTSPTIVGEYYTTPYSGLYNDGDPSRTTVDRYGNVWVANRFVGWEGEGSITKLGVVIGGTRGKKIGGVFVPDPNPLPLGQSPGDYLQPPFIYNTCIDRDRDGLIHTSYGLDNRLAWNDPALPAGDGDEAILCYVSTTPRFARSIAVDRDNNVWVGSRGIQDPGNGWQEMIDDLTGAPITGQKYHYGSGGYGGVIDPYGVLWSPGHNADGVLRLDPGPHANALPGTAGGILRSTSLPITSDAYGIGIDPTTGDPWAAGYLSGGLWHFKQGGCYFNIPFAATGNPSGNGLKGVVVDGTGNIWVAHAYEDPSTGIPGTEVYRFQNSGEYRGRVVLNHPTLAGVVGKSPHGVCIDSQGWVWAVCFQPASEAQTTGYYAMRIDPTQGVDPDTGNLVGTVVQAVDLGAFPYDGNYHGPYNYSDMTGFVALGTTQPAGVWDFVQDSGANYTVWSSATLDGDLNGGDIIIEVRAADRATDLPAWPFRRFTGSTGTIPFGAPALKGRYLETRVTLLRNFGALQSPVLRKLSLAWGAPGSNLQILQHPRSQIVNLGGPALFTVSATPTGVSYQWFRNGAALAGATSSSLLVNNAQYVNAGNYYVRVTDGAGAVLNSADARLHVNSTPDETRPIATEHNDDFPGYPKVGQTATFEASMNISPSSGPVFYQWRKNGVPIPATWGECTTSDFETYAAEAYIIPAVAGADTGSYSVVFTNQYWKVVSAPAVIIVCDESYVAVPQVTVDPPSPITITDRTQPPTITATPTFTAICQQWYLATFQFGWVKVPIPGATGLQLDTLPNPVPCSFLEPNVRLLIEVFDAGYIPHAAMVQLQGDCEP